jgi:hypothetical protein
MRLLALSRALKSRQVSPLLCFPIRHDAGASCRAVVSNANANANANANGTAHWQAPESGPMPPNLEEFIPGERLPDFIDVCINEDFLHRMSGGYSNGSSKPGWPIKFVRVYPPRNIDDGKGMSNTWS